MIMRNFKGVTCSGDPAENYHQLISTEYLH